MSDMPTDKDENFIWEHGRHWGPLRTSPETQLLKKPKYWGIIYKTKQANFKDHEI